MDKIELKDSILKAVEQEIDQWLEIEPGIESGLEYETKLLEAGRRMTKALLVHSMGKLPGSRNEKKTPDLFGPH